MSVNYNTPEYLTLTEYNEIITSNIRQNLVTVAQRLKPQGIISGPLLEQVQEVTGVPSRTNAANVVSAVSDKVLQNHMWFWEFVEVLLMEELSFEVGKQLRDGCAAKKGKVPKEIDDKIKEFLEKRSQTKAQSKYVTEPPLII